VIEAFRRSVFEKEKRDVEENTMKTRHLLLTLAAAAIAWIYTGTAAVAQEHDHAMKVGKTGEVTFDKETKVGDVTLKPGRYKFQHRVEGSDHFVHFTEWTKSGPGPITVSTAPKAHPGEVKCSVEPLNKKVAATTLYLTTEGDAMRITKVEVEGENVAHVL
jgi:hypothetical protein